MEVSATSSVAPPEQEWLNQLEKLVCVEMTSWLTASMTSMENEAVSIHSSHSNPAMTESLDRSDDITTCHTG